MKARSEIVIIPVRSEPSERAEMVTQILFGETFCVLESQEKWMKVQLDYDGYEGWVDAKMVTLGNIGEGRKVVVREPLFEAKSKGGSRLWLPAGSELLVNESNEFIYHRELFSASILKEKNESITLTAKQFLDAPYLWGGRTQLGIDCSGFTQLVYKLHHIKLPRDASQQVAMGEEVTSVLNAQEGDLAFFSNSDGRIIHVGICLNDGAVIHASGRVRIDKLDSNGIWNEERGEYSHQLSAIKRADYH